MKKLAILLLINLFLHPTYGIKKDSVLVLFVYGSKPLTSGEEKWFGGIHGGHVSIQYKNKFISFIPNDGFHYISKKNKKSAFVIEEENYFVFDTTNSRYLIISIPVDSIQKAKLDSVCEQRLKDPVYDYAFIGMRCASAAYELLSAAGIYKTKRLGTLKRKYFYPKLLRKKMIKEAKLNHWHMVYRKGKTSRKWEKD